MAGSILVRDLTLAVSTVLQDDNPQFTRYSEKDVIDVLNDGRRALHKFLPAAFSRVEPVKLKPGVVQSIESVPAASIKPGDGVALNAPVLGSLVLDVLYNMGADGLTPGRAIRPVMGGREALDAVDPMWPAATPDTTVRHFIFDPKMPRNFLAVPPVHAATPVWVMMSWVAMPEALPEGAALGQQSVYAVGQANAAKTVGVHDEHKDDLVNYACARLLLRNSQEVAASGIGAAGFAQMFVASINAKAMSIMGYNPNLKQLPFAPDVIGAAS